MTHQQHAVAKCSGRACHAPKLTPCPLSLPKRTSRGRCWQASAILKVADCRSEDAEALLLPALSSYDPKVRWRLADALFAQEKLRGRDSTRCRTIRLRKAYRETLARLRRPCFGVLRRPFHGTPHQRRSSRRDGAESPYLSGAQHGDHRSRVDAARHEPDLSFAGRSRPRWHRSGPALFKPLVLLIWLGALIMFVGGGLSLSDRRLRGGRAETNPSERRHAELACPSNAHAQFGIDLALKSELLSLKSLRRALPRATARI